MIPLRVHNILDYIGGAILLIAPTLFGFSQVIAARNVFGFLGVALIGYSLFTNYDFSIVKAIPVKVHMAFDAMMGLLLMLAPAVFGYRLALNNAQYAVHFVLGMGLIGLVVLTNNQAFSVFKEGSAKTWNRPASPRV